MTPQERQGHRLLQLGVTLFLLGLLVGFGRMRGMDYPPDGQQAAAQKGR